MKYLVAFLAPFLASLAGALAVSDPAKRDWPLLLVVSAAAGVGGLGGRQANAEIKKRGKK